MTMDRTHYNTLLDNSSPTAEDGSVWDKDDVNQLILAIDQLTDSRVGLFHSTTQSIPHDTLTAVTFDSEDYDVTALHNPAVNPTRVTIPSGGGGVYEFKANIVFASNTTGYRQVQFRKNGADIGTLITVAPVNGAATAVMHSAMLVLAAGDYVEVFVYQNSTAALNIGNATTRSVQNQLTMMKITRV